MNLQEVSYGLFGGDCGVLDPTRLVEYYLEEIRKISKVKPRFGVDVQRLILEADPKLDVPGEPFVWQKKYVTGVKTNKPLTSGLVFPNAEPVRSMATFVRLNSGGPVTRPDSDTGPTGSLVDSCTKSPHTHPVEVSDDTGV